MAGSLRRPRNLIDLSNGSTDTYLVEMRHGMIPRCLHCGQFNPILLDGSDYFRHFVQGIGHAQDNFPYLSNEQRELLISGTHPECWKALFAETNEEK